MPLPERFVLWAGDGPLNAVDEVADFIAGRIDESIRQCDKTDTCWLNDLVAYMCCLSAMANTYSGLTSRYSQVEAWRTKVLEIYEWGWVSQEKTEEYFTDKAYISAVINSLFEAVDHCTIPSARQSWTRC